MQIFTLLASDLFLTDRIVSSRLGPFMHSTSPRTLPIRLGALGCSLKITLKMGAHKIHISRPALCTKCANSRVLLCIFYSNLPWKFKLPVFCSVLQCQYCNPVSIYKLQSGEERMCQNILLQYFRSIKLPNLVFRDMIIIHILQLSCV